MPFNGTQLARPAPRYSYSKFALIALAIFALIGITPVASFNDTPVTVGAIQESALSNQLESLNEYVAVRDDARKPPVAAGAYLLMDADNAELLTTKAENQVIPVASTTKMVTALVVMEELRLSDVATISTKPPLIEGSKIGLKKGEEITIDSLLKGLLISSGNDAAFALAEYYANEPGNYQKFVDRMNDYVRSHGLTQSYFADPAGLDSVNGHSTAYELAHIARLLLKNKTLADIVSISQTSVSSVDGLITHELKNSNRLVIPDSPYFLPDALGVKTGFMPEAGHCLVAAYRWQGKLLIGVVMNTNEYSVTASASEMAKLFRWSENNLEIVKY